MTSWIGIGESVSPLERSGVDLVNTMLRRIQLSSAEQPWPSLVPVPEGPHYVYEAAPRLFFGRRGRGPLNIAWDTNLLIDYFQHGLALWDGESLPDEIASSHGEELEGLQLIITLWVLRDIRFHVPRFFLRDSKRKPLSDQQQQQRRTAMREFLRAISLVADGEGSDAPTPREPHPAEREVLSRVPAGNDRVLVREALRSGMDVFMTRDRGILAARSAVSVLGMAVASPLDVVEELAGAGALHCLFQPENLYWPMPDQARVAHLLHALDDVEA